MHVLCIEFSRKRNVFPDRGPLCVGVLPLGENRCMADRVGQILGNYQLLRLLGRGAFAEVYLAEHRYLEVPAAIKVLHVRMEPDTQAHFLREARTIAHVYMAAEQIRGNPCAASDQYAVGVLVYEWLCGEPPFVGSLFEVWSQHLSGSPPSLCARIPSLPLAVEDAVFSALAKEAQARFVSVQDFADVLEAMCEATQPLSMQVPSEHLH